MSFDLKDLQFKVRVENGLENTNNKPVNSIPIYHVDTNKSVLLPYYMDFDTGSDSICNTRDYFVTHSRRLSKSYDDAVRHFLENAYGSIYLLNKKKYFIAKGFIYQSVIVRLEVYENKPVMSLYKDRNNELTFVIHTSMTIKDNKAEFTRLFTDLAEPLARLYGANILYTGKNLLDLLTKPRIVDNFGSVMEKKAFLNSIKDNFSKVAYSRFI